MGSCLGIISSGLALGPPDYGHVRLLGTGLPLSESPVPRRVHADC